MFLCANEPTTQTRCLHSQFCATFRWMSVVRLDGWGKLAKEQEKIDFFMQKSFKVWGWTKQTCNVFKFHQQRLFDKILQFWFLLEKLLKRTSKFSWKLFPLATQFSHGTFNGHKLSSPRPRWNEFTLCMSNRAMKFYFSNTSAAVVMFRQLRERKFNSVRRLRNLTRSLNESRPTHVCNVTRFNSRC